MAIKIPAQVAEIIETIEKAGFEAYAVGGCVRDSLLGRVPGDWDITTSAMPADVKRLFRRTVDTGIQHGTVTVMLGKNGYEVTTYRIDGAYEDGRHPKEVAFTASLLEDLKRRDFTINAMAFNPRTGIVDEFDGMADLKAGIIRAVGCAEERFGEDALRILRAIRFSAQLGFAIEEKTWAAVCDLAPTLEKVSQERIQVELTKLLTSDNPGLFRLVYEAGITRQIYPEFDVMMATEQNTKYHCYSVGEHTIKVLEASPKDPVLRWAALLHDCGKPYVRFVDSKNGHDHFKGHEKEGADRAVRILKGLKFDNETIHRVQILIRWHDFRYPKGKPDVRRVLCEIGPELFEQLMLLIRADNEGKAPAYQEETRQQIDTWERWYHEVIEDGDCYNLKMLAVKGKDLIDAGIAPGKEMGEILGRLLERVLEDPALNERETLMGFVEQMGAR